MFLDLVLEPVLFTASTTGGVDVAIAVRSADGAYCRSDASVAVARGQIIHATFEPDHLITLAAFAALLVLFHCNYISWDHVIGFKYPCVDV